jgi:hypothetical protein
MESAEKRESGIEDLDQLENLDESVKDNEKNTKET